MQIDMRKLVRLAASREGIDIDPDAVPEPLWQVWRQQGQCVGQLVSLVLQYQRNPESF